MNRRINLITLATAAISFATGLVLLVIFHAGHGDLRGEALRLPRLVWVNVHRLAALAATGGAAAHIWLHRRGVMARLRHPRKFPRADLVLYFGFAIVSLAGVVAWFLVPGSPPLFGPIRLGQLVPQRRAWIDVHHWAGLAVLPATVIHVRKHWRRLFGDVHESQ